MAASIAPRTKSTGVKRCEKCLLAARSLIARIRYKPAYLSPCAMRFAWLNNLLRGMPVTKRIDEIIKEVQQHPLSASTCYLRHIDMGFNRLAKAAAEKLRVPTLLSAHAQNFEGLIPRGLRHVPALVMWLPLAHSGEIFNLGYAQPVISTRVSPDTHECDVVIRWVSNRFAFTAFEAPLALGEHLRAYHALPMIFATETHAAISAFSVDKYLFEDLDCERSRCEKHVPPAVRRAGVGPVGAGHECEFDAEGNMIVLLCPGTALNLGGAA